jgi:hypothetical protein
VIPWPNPFFFSFFKKGSLDIRRWSNIKVQPFFLVWNFWSFWSQIQWFFESEKAKIWKEFIEILKKLPARFWYMVQVSSQTYIRFLKKICIWIAKFGYMHFWMITTSATSKIWKQASNQVLVKDNSWNITLVNPIAKTNLH